MNLMVFDLLPPCPLSIPPHLDEINEFLPFQHSPRKSSPTHPTRHGQRRNTDIAMRTHPKIATATKRISSHLGLERLFDRQGGLAISSFLVVTLMFVRASAGTAVSGRGDEVSAFVTSPVILRFRRRWFRRRMSVRVNYGLGGAG
mmetsp:Transcript_23739/g.49323  ORF Transcript_23739/g.49323 Transcript_23739/m.49323 type:complete len:145 (-) Transcript_23739:11-445(-)